MPTYPRTEVFFNRQWRRAFKPDSTIALVYGQDTLTWSDQRSAGFKNPSYKGQIARHLNAGTPLSGSRFVVDRKAARGRVFFALEASRSGVSPQRLTWEILGDILDSNRINVLSPFADQPTRDYAVNVALTRFYERAWENIRSFDSGVFLGELRESLSMIRSPGKALRRGIDSYASTARKRARRASSTNGRRNQQSNSSIGKVLSDTWLEYAYGWRPLISDMKSGAAAIKRLSSDPVEYLRFTVEAGQSKDLITPALAASESVLFLNQMRYWYSVAKYVGSCTVQMQGEVRVRVENPTVFSEDVLGFNWESFAPTAWELIPYSFLVDYFSNVGSVISAWSFPRSRLTWWNRSIRNTAEMQHRMIKRPTPNPSPSDYKIVSDSGPSFLVGAFRTSFTRDQPDLGIPTVTLTIPGYGLKWLNMAALVGSRTL